MNDTLITRPHPCAVEGHFLISCVIEEDIVLFGLCLLLARTGRLDTKDGRGGSRILIRGPSSVLTSGGP